MDIEEKKSEGSRQRNGQALIEYCYILLLAVLVVILMIYGFGQTTNNTYCGINSTVTSVFK
jgi:Flp pilus assembly pilin Flp